MRLITSEGKWIHKRAGRGYFDHIYLSEYRIDLGTNLNHLVPLFMFVYNLDNQDQGLLTSFTRHRPRLR